MMLADPNLRADPDALHAELSAIHARGDCNWERTRPEILEHLKAARKRALAAAEHRLDETRSGIASAKTLAAHQDGILQALYRFCANDVFPTANPSVAERLTMIATGGYGRGLLAPGSDIDLLFLFPYRPTQWTESMVETILYLLWDMRLKVGHAARSVDECMKLARQDTTICTALLECRRIDGEPSLAEQLQQRFDQAVVRGTAKRFIAAKLDERDKRHKRQGRTRYLVEPNVKEGKGGLRDLNTLFWIAKYVYRVPSESELVGEGMFTDKEFRLFQRCDDFLWSVRCHLHFLTGRAEERLSFELQREIASRLGYTSRPGLSDVERFMKHYFLVAKDVGDLTRILCAALEEREMVQTIGLTRIMRTVFPNRQLSDDFIVDRGRINLAHERVFDDDPVNLVRLFAIASETDLRPHPDALYRIRSSLRLITPAVRADAEANRLMLDILTSTDGPDVVLRLMNEAGVLGAFLPDFGKIVAMMQFNMYHHYTVDEHLLRAVGILAAVARGEAKREHPLASRLIGAVHNRRALTVAVFLHDIAKGRPEDHSEAGAEVARDLCPRLGLSAAETDLVAWLIEEHLSLSITAQSRDLSDPKTVEDFAEKVQSRERLKLLTILTAVDIDAVGANVWNGWKAQLITTLYEATEAVLSASSPRRSRDARLEAAQKRFMDAATHLSPSARSRFVARQEDHYFLRVSTADALYHAELMEEGGHSSVVAGYRPVADRAVSEMTLIAPDTPELLAIVAAACASAQANIVSADIFTSNDGRAIDVFALTPLSDDADDERARIRRIAEMVRSALAGTAAVPRAVDDRPQAMKQRAFHHPTDVLIANDWSDGHTAIEVSGLDRPALFRDLADALAAQALNVRSAQLATFGERVVDVFYVTGADNGQITDKAQQQDIRSALADAFDGGSGQSGGRARNAA